MQISPISFSGLWFDKGQTKNVSNYVYRPFADESALEIMKEVDEYNGKTRTYYMGDNDYCGETTTINVEIGKKLNITTSEYERFLENGPREVTHSCDDVTIGK